VLTAHLRAAASYGITTRDALITRVRPEIRDGVVTRTIGEVQIFPDSARIDIVLGIGVTDDERNAAAAAAHLLPRQLLTDSTAAWNEVCHRRTGERMWRVALYVPASDPLVQLELEQIIDMDSEVRI